MSTVVNLFGGPGVGKSTIALLVAGELKAQGRNAEYVPEFVKEWVWKGIQVGKWDQLYLLGQQISEESRLYGKVDYIITDSPFLLSPIYEQLYQKTRITLHPAMEMYEGFQELEGVKYVNCQIARRIAYVPDGRYQKTVDEAAAVDTAISAFLHVHNIPNQTLNGEGAKECMNLVLNLL